MLQSSSLLPRWVFFLQTIQFLLKSDVVTIHTETQVAEGGWVEGERGERTPFEASLLSSLDHPGICLWTKGQIELSQAQYV